MAPNELLNKFLINLTHSVKPNRPHLFGKTEQIDLKTMKFFERYITTLLKKNLSLKFSHKTNNLLP